ncbi:RHH-type proline utilization regulon transcriptional repressor/proline dehydrogenase/delta 1-pyrroline-5-carboxylate dehydrogenase [Rhodoferax ferrireducens]|uniref:Bifunctional protein PutA n=1 Tax=Rhodoferax ferrireducens TaxID=192843 RepID=A0ABU2CEH2_9BURK|nr:bifunctional proline dehydrogenase/L-glutamate gamma-semialdehyde dehydrogenase PutA [Rhodoferax ferrireducens]MDR7379760.1 RHH-type proline utilization regulon transcriptional repressor/proline dehydrogenase/delta 1-pyrroline-5-carboxylate dehydrogenase [Rhodoferax ferrireducens]
MRLPTPYRPEAEVVAHRLAALSGALEWAVASAPARPWVQAVRDNPPPFWAMESLLREYPISSAEGLALMRLAEALLRVPDAETAIALTADQLGRADFDGMDETGAAQVLGRSTLAKLSSSAIALSKKFLPDAEAPQGLLTKLGAKTVVAATVRAVQLLGRQFVLGQTIGDAMDEADAARKKQAQLTYSYDMLGEGARTDADALNYLQSYKNAIEAIAARADKTGATEKNDGISIKLSALHPRYEWTQRERVLAELVPRVWSLCEQAARANINLTIDAEEVDRLELSLDVFEALAALVAQHQPQWRGFGLAMQAYQTRALELIEHIASIGRKYKLRLMCRLVKGAYWDSEIKRAQELGLPHYPVFTHKHHTDVSYLACAKALLDAPDAIYPQFATHNAATIAAILSLAAKSGNPFELQRLHGMGEGVYREVLKNPLIGCRVYAPVGKHRDLLAYLVRRLLENGANSSFVHQLADESVGMEEILVSPLRLEPESAFVLPPKLFGAGRKNSAGLDLEVATQRAALQTAFDNLTVPSVPEFDAKQAASAYATSATSYKIWSKAPVAERAALLRQSADALEHQMPRFCAILVKEAFKTWGDAVSEVREAVDFLRFYADEAERIMAPVALPGPTGETNELRLSARGVWVCISPWNFPLAIFMGQVAAALATGNTVLAKPAEQTPFVALEAVRLLHSVGVPEAAVQLLHGPGETVGAALVALPGIAGVVFTGSTPVARTINRALAAKDGPIVPLIAETGGINAMLVDSTALPEQVVDAVVQSAFRSAGQRCSALRLLCVHEAIADHVIEMVQGAAKELVLGNTAEWATDVGPVIDKEAFDGIQKHIQRLHSTAKPLLAQSAPARAAANLIAPQAFELKQVSDVAQEIFGPVLHIVRWSGDPQAVIEQINALGYGLTLGIQTRIDSRAHALAAAAHIGNVYINRNIIGAVVGVQPFGGEGLSGTGPKAGGPHYLYRFCAEQTLTVNTTAAGGNAALLASMP